MILILSKIPEETGSVGIDIVIESWRFVAHLKSCNDLLVTLWAKGVRGVTEKLLTRTLSGVVYAAIVLAALFVGKEATIASIAGVG